jgi:uncharacterized protein (TIGR02266 family)
MPTAGYAFVFARPSRERLAAAAQLVSAVPTFLSGAEGELDLHHRAASGYTAAVTLVAPEAFTPEALARLGFWSARLGARAFLVDALPEEERGRFEAELRLCDRTLLGTPLSRARDVAARFFRAIGVATPPQPAGARPVLAVDLDGPGAEGIAYRPESRALFVAGVLAPACGDQLVLSVRHEGASGPVDGLATVVEVRRREGAGPGCPAGFTLRLEGSAPLHELLARHARAQPGREVRAAPRYPVKAPVKVTPAPGGPAARAPEPAAAGTAPPLRARVEYATDQELAADWIENLSHGGAFVRTSSPHPEGAELEFELALPDGARLEAKAVVAFVNAKGMGLRFVLSPEQDGLLSAAIARISARPRRALVVDDDVLARRMIADALAERGFEVLTAEDGQAGIHKLLEELLALDLFITDVVMPGLGGEALIRTIRQAGGEADLAIVAVSSFLEPGTERALEQAGADAVLDKALGAELVAQAADAVLERKRLVQRADAA